jgi:hypothetical protein
VALEEGGIVEDSLLLPDAAPGLEEMARKRDTERKKNERKEKTWKETKKMAGKWSFKDGGKTSPTPSHPPK